MPQSEFTQSYGVQTMAEFRPERMNSVAFRQGSFGSFGSEVSRQSEKADAEKVVNPLMRAAFEPQEIKTSQKGFVGHRQN